MPTPNPSMIGHLFGISYRECPGGTVVWLERPPPNAIVETEGGGVGTWCLSGPGVETGNINQLRCYMNIITSIACTRSRFARIMQPRQFILRRHSPVRIAAAAIIFAIAFGVRPVYFVTIVLRCPHQVRPRVQDCSIVIGDKSTVSSNFIRV